MILKVFELLPKVIEMRSLWLMLFLVKAVMALLLALPFFMTVNSFLATSAFARPLAGAWDLSVLLELVGVVGESLPALIMIVISGIIVYVLIKQFFNGGLYYTVVSGKTGDIDWRTFFAESGSRFMMHVRITLLMGLIYMALIFAGMFIIGLIDTMAGGPMGFGAMVLSALKLGVLFYLLLAASFFSDSARAAATAHPDKKTGEVLNTGADFFRPRLLRLTVAFLVTYVPFVLIWVAFERLALGVTGQGLGVVGIVVEGIFFQVCAVLRTGQKLWFLTFFGKEFRGFSQGRFLPEQVELRFDDR